MGRRSSINLVTRFYLTHFLLFTISVFFSNPWLQNNAAAAAAAAISTEFVNGFKATPDPSTSTFQPLLTDSTRNFSLGFLRVDHTQLNLAVIHVPSSEPLWLALAIANPSRSLPRWSESIHLSFNGSLVISDEHRRVIWSTNTDGDRVSLLNTSNLQIQNLSSDKSPPFVLWQSFDFPGNTLVENQNFTVAMSLVSSNGQYTMRLGDNFIGLYATFRRDSDQIYLRHKALQAKADIIAGKGPIYARVNTDGYLGMYQLNDTIPVDVEAFNSFQRPINGLLMIRLEPDGNLKGYYWDGSNWTLDYQMIRAQCELPSPCGSYGLCKSGSGCSCLNNQTEYIPEAGGCTPPDSGDFCGKRITDNGGGGFSVLRREGIELPYKELMRYQTTSSLEDCEGLCANNCSCWGAVYNNASRFCYLLDYPIQTLVSVGDDSKVGYFKVRESAVEGKVEVGLKVGIGLMCVVILVCVGLIGFGLYRFWRRKRRVRMFMDEDAGISPGPYKDLASASFRSIEMSSSSSSTG